MYNARNNRFCRRLFTLFVCIGALSACGTTQPSRFYLLAPTQNANQTNKDERFREIVLAVGPISLPEYLNRSQLVRRTQQNSLEINDFDRWAEPLTPNFTRVLAENLAYSVGTDRVTIYPGLRTRDFDYQVIMDVLQFDVNEQNQVTLSARWAILGERGKTTLAMRKSTFTQAAQTDSYQHAVAVQSELTALIGKEIAEEIRRIHAQ